MTDFYFEDRIAPAAILGATHRLSRSPFSPRGGRGPSIAFDKKIMVLKNMHPPAVPALLRLMVLEVRVCPVCVPSVSRVPPVSFYR